MGTVDCMFSGRLCAYMNEEGRNRSKIGRNKIDLMVLVGYWGKSRQKVDENLQMEKENANLVTFRKVYDGSYQFRGILQ